MKKLSLIVFGAWISLSSYAAQTNDINLEIICEKAAADAISKLYLPTSNPQASVALNIINPYLYNVSIWMNTSEYTGYTAWEYIVQTKPSEDKTSCAIVSITDNHPSVCPR